MGMGMGMGFEKTLRVSANFFFGIAVKKSRFFQVFKSLENEHFFLRK